MNKLAMLALGRKVGGSGGSGGVSSWNDLTDKPFYEKRTILFQCDFDTSGPDYLPVEGMGALYKVTDDVFTSDDLVGGTMIGKKGTTITVTSEMINEQNGILMLTAVNEESLCVFFLLSTSTTDTLDAAGFNVPSTGTYVIEASPEVIGIPPELEVELLASIEAVIIKKLDEKFLPKTTITLDKLNEVLGVIEDGSY